MNPGFQTHARSSHKWAGRLGSKKKCDLDLQPRTARRGAIAGCGFSRPREAGKADAGHRDRADELTVTNVPLCEGLRACDGGPPMQPPRRRHINLGYSPSRLKAGGAMSRMKMGTSA